MYRPSIIKTRLLSRIKGLPNDAWWMAGAGRSLFRNARGGRILVYHGICRKDPLRFNTLFLTLKTFESQLKLYKEYFNLISLDDYYQGRFDPGKFNLCLTFDDGFANNYKYVLPLLDQYEVPAVFFITGIRQAGFDILWNDLLSVSYEYGPSEIIFKKEKYIKSRDRKYVSTSTGKFLADLLRLSGFEDKAEMIQLLSPYKEKAEEDYWLQMQEEQIREVSLCKWATIGSHGHYHNDLAKISIALAKDEMIRSKLFLENTTGTEIKALAFPYGSYSPDVLTEAKKAGYSQLLATEFISQTNATDATLRERLTINPFISNISQLYASISGNYK